MFSLGSFKSLFSKDNLKTAAGIIGAGSLNKIVVAKWGDKLPGLTQADGSTSVPAAIGYSIAIPGVVGILVRKYDRAISDGLILGGLAFGAMQAISAYASPSIKTTLGFSEYLTAPNGVRGLSASITGAGAGRVFSGNGRSIMSSASPFKPSNW